MQDLITLFFGTTTGIVFVVAVVSLVILIIGITVCDYFSWHKKIESIC